MTTYFRKSFKVAPGVHLNLSKRGTGVSFGPSHAHLSFSPTGRITKTVSIPGTGIYYRDVSTTHSKSSSTSHASSTHSDVQATPPAESPVTPPAPSIHHDEAVEHHGFYISHSFATFASIFAAIFLALRVGTHPLNPWIPIFGVVAVISFILWARDAATNSRKGR